MGACALAIPKARRDGYFLTFVFICFGVGCALTASDYIAVKFGNDRLFAHFTIAGGVGSVGGAMFMVIRAISPTFAESIVNIASKTAIAFAESKMVKAVKYIFGSGDIK